MVIEKYEFIQERVIQIVLKTIAKYGNGFQNNQPVTINSMFNINVQLCTYTPMLCK